MDLGTVFKLSLYGLTALVGAILGAAEGEGVAIGSSHNHFVLPFVSLPLVVFGYLATEGLQAGKSAGGRGLSSMWANLLGTIALIATAMEFFSENREGKLLAGTHLLLYVTWIVLFQQKTVRLYWFLMALGILQLAVASVLTSKGWFGFCAVGYMFGAVWTLSIFSLWRAERLFADEDQKQRVEDEASRKFLGSGPSRIGSQSSVRSAVHHEGGTRWLSIRFVTGVLMTTCSALVVSSVFFAFIPRVWVGPEMTASDLGEASNAIQRRTGLATSVRLGYLGPVLESKDRVFEIQLFNVKTQRTMSVQSYAELMGLSEPLFRGAVLVYYDNGRWSHDEAPVPPVHRFKARERSLTDVSVKQEIYLEPSTTDVLFSLDKPLMVVDRRDKAFGEFDQSTGILAKGEENIDGEPLQYTVYTSLPLRIQSRFKQKVRPEVRHYYEVNKYLAKARRLPKGLRYVEELTQKIIERETVRINQQELRETPRRLSPLEVATALEFYLRDSGEFRYTVDISIIDSKIDPIEDFLVNRKEGHCEYFATALALMLRAANIPARVVSGYKGGVPLPSRDLFEVQQRFAHLWVEAWVDNEGWTTFDATPEDQRSQSIASMSTRQKSLWAGMQTTFSGLWSDNVLNMSLDRQEASLYRPIRKVLFTTGAFLHQLFTEPSIALRSLVASFFDRKELFSVEGGMFAFLFMIFIVGIVFAFRISIRWLKRWMGNRSLFGGNHRRRMIDFYERYLRIARAKGLKPAPHQTQREFADVVSSAYSPELEAFGIHELPTNITRLFYKVRYGDLDLSSSEMNEVEELLGKFELALSNGSHRS